MIFFVGKKLVFHQPIESFNLTQLFFNEKLFDSLQDGPSTDCVSTSPDGVIKTGSDTHLKCTSADAHCAGKAKANFVYGLEYRKYLVDERYITNANHQ